MVVAINNSKQFTLNDTCDSIKDVAHLVAIVFQTTDLYTISKALEIIGYPFGACWDDFTTRLMTVHGWYLEVDRDINKIKKSYGGLEDYFDFLHK
tara:strand:- start:65211 stop:65495 length:285 start_codon:yes stop_codon:yes gene_type:complete